MDQLSSSTDPDARQLRFAGRIAVVTGASRGIGFAIAKRLVQEGARVVITGRTSSTLDDAVADLGGEPHALAVAGKADDPEHQAQTISRALEVFGSIDYLVNNAGTNPVHGSLMELSLTAARKIFEVNCLSVLEWVRHAWHAGMEQHGGAIVNVTSVAGLRPAPGIGFYGASKAMLGHITQQLALELAPVIRVNAVAPAVVKTKFAAALYEGREDTVAAEYPSARLGIPSDVAGTVAFLLSDDASWLTGHTVVLDGGKTLTGGA